jgi:hypothetical protein
VVAQIGKARTGYGAYISGSDYSYLHGRQRALNPRGVEYNKGAPTTES